MNIASCDCVIPHWDWSAKKSWPSSMVFGGEGGKQTSANSRFGFSGSQPACLNLRIRREWECLALKAITPVGDEIPSSPHLAEQEPQPTRIARSTPFHKDLNSLPSQSIPIPLSLSLDLLIVS